ncbi:U-box domain-containing protein 19-like [Magnolia sinica]|uniref:U-box domain-containing protein 19-like n=1 Tax=Magnolia sinica TaxID=86752 RepID=UPI0026597C7B|nr:U-box domain-containing protein 19-like [Magnolia sinica]
MTQKSNRRILTFPAVRPCEGVSPAALLHALITVSHTVVDHRTKFFPVHKRNVRETIREIEILLLFLEEIASRGSRISGSIVVCFSELYVVLQKMRYLLEDCSHEGARLWILMQSERVTHEFRILIRSIATALEVIPLKSIDVPTEIRELIELVGKQSQKVKIETDPCDERAANDVLDILGAFENKIVPDSNDLKRVLNHLEIRSWSDCNKEIRFLEEEIQCESSKGEEKEIVLLFSLLGFMNYCRSVLFDDLDGGNNERSDCRHGKELDSSLNPEDFKCPITLELMKDPVTIATGQTYDRSSIVRWFKAGHLICPKTGEKLMSTELIPNYALQKLIQKFCNDNGVVIAEVRNHNHKSEKAQFRSSPVALESMRMLSVFLFEKLSIGTETAKNKTAYEIRLLAKTSMFHRACLVEAGVILGLLNLLSSSNPTAQENAISALLNLSKHSKGKTVIFESGGLGSIIHILQKGLKTESRNNAAAVLFYLSSVEEYREAIGDIPEAIPMLVGLLQSGNDRGKKNAAVAIFGLLQFPGNHRRVLAAGAIPPLLNLLKSERLDLATDSLAVLASLAEKTEGTVAITRASAIQPLVGYLHSSGSRTGSEYCASILFSLSINGGLEVVTILKKMPLLTGSLYSLLTEGSSRASKKARLILSLLHGGHNPGPSGMQNSTVRRERAIVHVM